MKVTIEFDSADEAIVALGAVLRQTKVVVPEAEAKVKTERKPRADKGQPREPYKPRQQEASGVGAGSSAQITTDTSNAGATKPAASTSTGAPDASPPNVAPAAPVAQAQEAKRAESTPPAAATITNDTVQAALEKLFNKLDYVGSIAVLQRFGVRRGPDLAQGQRAEFLRRVEDICAGRYASTDAWPA